MMNKRNSRAPSSACRGVLAVAADRRGAQDTLKIGLLSTLEGPFAAGGPDGMRGADLALKQKNGMAGGKKIEFVKVSSDATPDKAVERHAQGRRAGQGADHDRPAVRRRGHRGQELRQDAAQHHLHQRHLGRAGDDAGRSVAQLLPLQHRGCAVDGGPGRTRARQGLQEDLPDRRGLRLPVFAGAGLHGQLLRQGRQGGRQGLGAAGHQGLRVGDRQDPEGHRRAGGRARRRRRGELPHPVRAGRRQQADGRWLDHGGPDGAQLQGQAPRVAARHRQRRADGRFDRHAGVEDLRRRLQGHLQGRFPEPELFAYLYYINTKATLDGLDAVKGDLSSNGRRRTARRCRRPTSRARPAR